MKYLYVDIDDIYYNNKIDQINSDLYSNYYNFKVKNKNFKVEFIRFTNQYPKEYYSNNRIFKTINKFANNISSKKIDYLKIHVTYRNVLNVLILSKAIKHLNFKIKIILFGVYLKNIYLNILNLNYIDQIELNVQCNESEKIKKFENKKISFSYFNEELSDKLNKIKIKEEESIVNNGVLLEEMVNIKIGEGCIYNCNYCTFKNLYFDKYSQFNTDYILNTIKHYCLIYGTKNFMLNHELFIMKKETLKYFCDGLKRKNININWSCSSRIEYLNDKNLEMMKKAGCNYIFIGIESASSTIQKKMNKNINVNNIIQNIENIFKRNINVILSFIYDYPEEKCEDYIETFKLIYNIKKLEKLHKLGISLIEINKIKFFPNTYITKKYYEDLQFDKYLDTQIKFYPGKIINFIQKNKAIFTDYFNLKKNIDKLKIGFDNFSMYLFNDYVYQNFENFEKILYSCNFDIIELYKTIRKNNTYKLKKLLVLIEKDKLGNSILKSKLLNELMYKEGILKNSTINKKEK